NGNGNAGGGKRNFELAWECFREVASLYYRLPKLWMRMAECCALSLAERERQSVGVARPLIQVVGKGKSRRVVLVASRGGEDRTAGESPTASESTTTATTSTHSTTRSKEEQKGSGEDGHGEGTESAASLARMSATETVTSVPFAIRCVRTALFLMSRVPP